MNLKKYFFDILNLLCLFISCLSGIFSINFDKEYLVKNQYGQDIMIYGSGIYSHDSYFKAPILIGTDISILIVVIPLAIIYFNRYEKNKSQKNILKITSIYGVILYYATSVAFGVFYNKLFLIYLILFSTSLFNFFRYIMKINNIDKFNMTKSLKIFLILSAISIILAWLPDIVFSIWKNEPLVLIEIYTTPITCILDMGIIGPSCILIIYLSKHQNSLATIMLAIILKLSIIIGIIMITQTFMQMYSGINLPVNVIITKSCTFLILALFSCRFNKKLYDFL